MKAYDFQFDGRFLHEFEFVICNFNSKGLKTVTNGSEIKFNTVSSLNGAIHNIASAEYKDCLKTTIQICRNYCSSDMKEISSTELRELTKWLNRKKFLKLKFLDEDYIDLYFEATFNINRIEFDGRLYGLELDVITNRPFALKEQETINVYARNKYVWEKYMKTNNNEKGDKILDYVSSYKRDFYPDNGVKNNFYYVFSGEEFENTHSIDDSSYEEGYIYPYTEIIVNEDGDLNIYNAIEDRNTCIANCVAGEVIIMDYPIIQSSVSSHNIQDDFNWNFFRIANSYGNSRNDLTISILSTIKIKYSPIVKIGL